MEIAPKFRMSLPPPPVALPVGPLNPIEVMITGINTNTYLIGMSMILLNLGGRHLLGHGLHGVLVQVHA